MSRTLFISLEGFPLAENSDVDYGTSSDEDDFNEREEANHLPKRKPIDQTTPFTRPHTSRDVKFSNAHSTLRDDDLRAAHRGMSGMNLADAGSPAIRRLSNRHEPRSASFAANESSSRRRREPFESHLRMDRVDIAHTSIRRGSSSHLESARNDYGSINSGIRQSNSKLSPLPSLGDDKHDAEIRRILAKREERRRSESAIQPLSKQRGYEDDTFRRDASQARRHDFAPSSKVLAQGTASTRSRASPSLVVRPSARLSEQRAADLWNKMVQSKN